MSAAWTPERIQLLFLCMIDNDEKMSSEKWEKAAAVLGGGVSGNACRQAYFHFYFMHVCLLSSCDLTVLPHLLLVDFLSIISPLQPSEMSWTAQEDRELMLRVLDLNITIDRDTFEEVARAMGSPFNTVRYG